MPGMNGTGPSGQGAMTGGGFGRCNPNAGSGQMNGRGMGRGRGNARLSRRGEGAGYGAGAGRGAGAGAGRGAGAGYGVGAGYGAGYARSNQPTDAFVDDEVLRRNEELEMMLEKANAENAKLSVDNQKLRDFEAAEKKGSDKKAK